MTMRTAIMLGLLCLLLTSCAGDPPPVKGKAYYLAHHEELEAENRACRDTGRVATDEDCMPLGVIRTEILKDEVGARIRAR